jgi:peptidoglycan-associated lipoprotein
MRLIEAASLRRLLAAIFLLVAIVSGCKKTDETEVSKPVDRDLAMAADTVGAKDTISSPGDRCKYAGLESIPASSPQCVAPAPPMPPAPGGPPGIVVDSAPIFQPIYFGYRDSRIDAPALASLEHVLRWMSKDLRMRIRIEGNSDDMLDDLPATKLGRQRALAARSYLMLHGISGDRSDVVSYGQDRPTCTEPDSECRKTNRRVEFTLVTVGPEEVVGSLSTPTIDSLQWPPPQPSVEETLPLRLCHDPANATVQGSWDLLHAAFGRAGFPGDERTYTVGRKEGFAVVGRIEAINDDATFKPEPNRFVTPAMLPHGSFELSQVMRALFARVTGRYRVIMLIVTTRSLVTSPTPASAKGIDVIMGNGVLGPPPRDVAILRMAPGIPCYALVYELERPADPRYTSVIRPSLYRAKMHVARAHLWTNTQLGIP